MFSPLFSTRRPFSSLSEKEILALAIASEEEDGHRYRDMAAALEAYPATANLFSAMADEEDAHRHSLLELYTKRFGKRLPLIQRDDVAGFVRYPAVSLTEPVNLTALRHWVAALEGQNRRFYQLAAAHAQDTELRKLLGDLAVAEGAHEVGAVKREGALTESDIKSEHDESQRAMLLQVVQPGLAGLVDGSVSTLAPIFASALATGSSHATLLVGLAASVGAGISMGLTEGMSDDGKLSGRGSPWVRGAVCGVATAIGGLGHTLPYLIPHVQTATFVAIGIVIVELFAIAHIRTKYMETPFWQAIIQVVLGGALVVAVGLLLGAS